MDSLLVIGIDGADWEYVSAALEAGRLPVLGRLAEEGCFGPLRSTLPPLSCPAWPVMSTGMNPGNIGVFDLSVPEGYSRRIVNSGDIDAPRLWDYVGAAGGASVVVNVPVTYPPRPIDGALVAGFLSPPDSEYSRPEGLARKLEDRFAYSTAHASSKRAKLQAVRRRRDAFLYLLERQPWNLAMVVFSATDWAQHDHWEDRSFLRRLFQEVDAAVGEIVARANATNVAIISDHGFTGADRILNLNRLLCDLGFLDYGESGEPGPYAPNLSLTTDEGGGDGRGGIGAFLKPRTMLRLLNRLGIERMLDLIPSPLWQWLKEHFPVWQTPIDWSRTRAFLDNGPPQTIRVNLAGREPEGIVPPDRYADVREEVAEALRAARDPLDGTPVFTRVMARDDAFPGRHTERAPDLIFDVRDDAYLVSPADHPDAVWRTGKARGRHRTTGVCIARGPAFLKGRRPMARLLDMTPTLLCAAGCPPPEGIDGTPSAELLAESHRKKKPHRYEVEIGETAKERLPGDDVKKRLQHLGYM